MVEVTKENIRDLISQERKAIEKFFIERETKVIVAVNAMMNEFVSYCIIHGVSSKEETIETCGKMINEIWDHFQSLKDSNKQDNEVKIDS